MTREVARVQARWQLGFTLDSTESELEFLRFLCYLVDGAVLRTANR